MSQTTLKIHGQSGQGIETLGMILANSLLKSGYFVFTHREYPSLIKGGNANFQIEFGDKEITSPHDKVNISLVLNKLQTLWKLDELAKNAILITDVSTQKLTEAENQIIKNKNVNQIYINTEQIIAEAQAEIIMKNIVLLGTIAQIIGLDIEVVKDVISTELGNHSEKLEMNFKLLELGSNYNLENKFNFPTLKLNNKVESNPNKVLMTGHEAVCLGAISAGLKFFFGYPMTPASNILKYLTENAKAFNIYARQVEDEISAITMSLGSSLGGARSMTATSGGGYDLMTEQVSYAGISETPIVVVLAQRPGPSTGMPTWTAQGDLNLAIYGGHGEFPKLVMSLSDPYSAHEQIQNAFNFADKYQLPVIVLTDKFLAESNFTVDPTKFKQIAIDRNLISLDDVTSLEKLPEEEKRFSEKRYEFTASGISPRWLPGTSSFDYDINSDEHDEFGNVTEDADMASRMYEKRMRKLLSLRQELPEPEIFTNQTSDKQTNLDNLQSYISWGSTKCNLQTHLQNLDDKNIPAQFLHFEYLWPLKTEKLIRFLNKYRDAIVAENNYEGQFANLIQKETGIMIVNRINNWNGRNINFNQNVKDQ